MIQNVIISKPSTDQLPVMFLGGGCSSSVEPLAALTGRFYNAVQVSCVCVRVCVLVCVRVCVCVCVCGHFIVAGGGGRDDYCCTHDLYTSLRCHLACGIVAMRRCKGYSVP